LGNWRTPPRDPRDGRQRRAGGGATRGILGTLSGLALAGVSLSGCASLLPGHQARAAEPGPAAAATPGTAAPPTAAGAALPAPEPAPPAAALASIIADDSVMDRVVAVVNNDVITLNELRESVLYVKVEGRAQDMDESELARQLLGRLIDGRLQLQEADREHIVVEESELAEELAERMKKVNAKSDEEFEAMVKRQGLTLEAVKQKLREQILISKVVRRKVAFRVSVTEEEIDRYLEQNRDKLETGLTYHARHIVLTPEGEPTEAAWNAARDRAAQIRNQLQGGADFAELARQHSSDGSVTDGGDLGTLSRGELDPAIEVEILKLAPGEVSAPVKTGMGYHLFKLESKQTLDGEGLGRVRQQIRDILFREKYQARFDAWLKEIKERAIIEVRI
jgi:peptidyl-prolyl cis-trans isomerase SurA